VTEAVVDPFETVEIKKQHRKLASGLAFDLGESQRQTVHEQDTVRESGEVVVQRVVLELFFGQLARGDVGLRAGHSRRRAVRSANGEPACEHPDPAAVGGAYPVLETEVLAVAV